MYPTSAYTFNITHYNVQQYRDALNEKLNDLDTPIDNMVIALDSALREYQKQLDLLWAEIRYEQYLIDAGISSPK